jgi:methionyl-tRNA synthetase
VLCNLKPAAMRGIKSHAMVLAASNSDHTEVSIYPSVFENHVGSGTGFFSWL